jgi:hypothetical protein
MKILLATDSRGYCPGNGNNWVDKFSEDNSQHEIIKQNWSDGTLSTLFGLCNRVETAKTQYDLIVVQLGYHEYVSFWTKRVFGCKIRKADPQYEQNLTWLWRDKNGNDIYRYRNDNLILKTLKQIKKYTKAILFIGVHQPYVLGTEHEDATLIMNFVYSSGCDFLSLPVHSSWANIVNYDRIHYNQYGAQYICSYLTRYVVRLNKDIATILEVYNT